MCRNCRYRIGIGLVTFYGLPVCRRQCRCKNGDLGYVTIKCFCGGVVPTSTNHMMRIGRNPTCGRSVGDGDSSIDEKINIGPAIGTRCNKGYGWIVTGGIREFPTTRIGSKTKKGGPTRMPQMISHSILSLCLNTKKQQADTDDFGEFY